MIDAAWMPVLRDLPSPETLLSLQTIEAKAPVAPENSNATISLGAFNFPPLHYVVAIEGNQHKARLNERRYEDTKGHIYNYADWIAASVRRQKKGSIEKKGCGVAWGRATCGAVCTTTWSTPSTVLLRCNCRYCGHSLRGKASK